MEAVSEAEIVLANELRSYCSHYGVERPECLDRTGTLLWKIGKLYLEKADVMVGMVQKLSLIRCAVLLYAAKARFCITKNDDMQSNVSLAIFSLQAKLERCCNCKPKTSLCEISHRLHGEVNCIRKRAKSDISREVARNDPIQDKVTFLKKTKFFLMHEELVIGDDDNRNLSRSTVGSERVIIDGMREFMDDITKQYISIMGKIAEECLDILPEPPCNFCIAGLGSLARGEVTMYSDFEHVILLDANVNAVRDYEDILEYFRWFSVLFQIIVVGMGETIIPSVTIPSLNDAYSGDPSRNWFYDKYTPRGISFDGMLPHSCNIPLGRTQTTPKRRHTVELIQTPKMMALFLSYGECEKNGYYLGEVLRQTCLVYGAEDIYNAFVSEKRQVLKSEVSFSEEKYRKFVINNSNANVRENRHLHDVTTFDAKNAFYRPVVTLLTFLGQFHDIESTSSFDLLDQLLKNGAIEKEFHHDLCYALAVACEMRWKLYLFAEEQRHSTDLDSIGDVIGENAVHACKNVLPKLRNLISREKDIETGPDKTKEIMISISSRGNHEEAVLFGEKVIELYSRDGKDTAFFKLRVFCECYKAGCIYPSKRAKYWKKTEDLYRNTFCGGSLSYLDAIEIHLRMSVMYYTQGRIDESMEESLNYFEANRMMLQIDGKIHREFAPNFQQYHELVFQRMNATDAEGHLESIWNDPSIEFSIDCQFTKRYYKVLMLLLKNPADGNSLKEIKRQFRELALDAKMNSSKLAQPRRFLFTIIFRQISYVWLDDVILTIEYIEQNPGPAYSQYELALVEESCIDVMKFFCYCRLGMYKEALSWAESGVTVDHDRNLLHRLTYGLVSKLWAWMQSKKSTYGIKERTLILLFIIQFRLHEKTPDLFSCPRGLNRSNLLDLTMDSLETHYKLQFDTKSVQAVRNIRSVMLVMLIGFPQFTGPAPM